MDPKMRIGLAAAGAFFGARLASPGSQLFDVVIGACAGWFIGELIILRSRLAVLSTEITRLRTELARQNAAPTPSTPGPVGRSPDIATSVRGAPPALVAPALVAPALVAPAPSTHELAPPRRAAEAPPRPAAIAQSPIVAAIRGFITGGNTVVRAGVIVLFFGIAFLLRYMAEHSHVPIEIRLTGVALGSLVLLALGWRLRTARSGYALALQGGGVGVLYLTVFAALRLYGILPAAMAFPILVAVAVLSASLAVLQNSMAFAVLGVSGGFLAPVLASSGQGSHVVLFSYYAVLNAGILGVSWFRAWRPLNVAGFVFTFAIGTAWGVLKYRAEDFATIEPFLVLFFLFYLVISILFTLRQPPKLTGYVDGTLIFGTPIVVFALQSCLLHERLMALALSAVAMSAVYLAIAWVLQRRRAASQALLFEAFIAIGVAFLTLAVPLALDARWNAATWALEGAALTWVGCRQGRVLPRVAGGLLSLASGAILASQIDWGGGHVLLPFRSYFGVLIQSAAALSAARMLYVHRQRLKPFEEPTPELSFAWGWLWWVAGGINQLSQHLPPYAAAASLVFITLTCLMCSEIHRRLPLVAARYGALLQLPAMLVFAVHAIGINRHPSALGGWLAWPAASVGLYVVLSRLEGPPRAALANLLHAVSLWLLLGLLSWEMAWAAQHAIGGSSAWPDAAWAAFPALFLLLLPRLVTRIAWPFARNRDAYLLVAGIGVAFCLSLWSLVTNVTSQGDSSPLPYAPLLNPLDVAQACVLLALFAYWRCRKSSPRDGFPRMDARIPVAALSALLFVELNAMLLRTLHQWFGIAFDLDAMLQSTLVQTCLTIFWAILAIAAMLVAARRGMRPVWLVGASLLAVTVAKLFLVDLARIGSIERIVSFVGVGMLMLIVGYFSPIPPAVEARP